jgi:hypothetical protein
LVRTSDIGIVVGGVVVDAVGWFVLLFWGTGSAFMPAMVLSGSSLFTLGFEKGVNGLQLALVFLASASGMVMVTLLIGYLPTIYSAFSAREKAIAMLDTRAGNPPRR